VFDVSAGAWAAGGGMNVDFCAVWQPRVAATTPQRKITGNRSKESLIAFRNLA
jgi:hypothetical protein